MKLAVITVLTAASCFAPFAIAKPKPKAPCAVFFQISRTDAQTMDQDVFGMDDDQGHWWIGYEDHGKGNGWFRGHESEGKYAGICFLRGEMPAMSSSIPQYAPVYWIRWGYHSYDTLYEGTTVTHPFLGGTVSVWDYSANDGKGGWVYPTQLSGVPENPHLFGNPFSVREPRVVVLKQALDMILRTQENANKAKEPWQH